MDGNELITRGIFSFEFLGLSFKLGISARRIFERSRFEMTNWHFIKSMEEKVCLTPLIFP